ncbi:polyprenyl synthetase [Oscillochloris trichoides DG-6]|uniref:Polyprenyl synthetase n=1 Tax=Oscillochloris trichoides DG-6 TaxID=765420 RepID=E1IIC7_9CHLR|nr:polyprenyl synthetase family protein [Oscillochloris trichoides]EFO79077.1 polyprenyl synthetase [Oscillochloris trichoides DG-6]
MFKLPLPATITDDLQAVDRIVRERTASRSGVIGVAEPTILRPDAMRPRAALVLLAAHLGEYQLERTIHAAAAVELIYAATRTHNDLIDAAERRRGQARQGDWGHGLSLMVGDYLFALAAGEMALSPDPRVISSYSQAVMRICESELAPIPGLRPLEVAQAAYFAHTGSSAAALYAAACQAGAACGGLAGDQVAALAQYGHELGVALRISTEIHDFTTPTEAGASLRRGVVSLPLILAAQHGDGERLEAALNTPDSDHAWAVAEVRQYGLVPAQAEVQARLAAARAALVGLPEHPARMVLESVEV